MTIKAVILAAGRGQRLGSAGQIEPKCLLRFGPRSLLQRHLAQLHALAIGDIALCVGYRADLIRRELVNLGADPRVCTVANPDFERGSMVSLWHMREHLRCGHDLLLMDADVLCDGRMLARLVRSAHRNVFLMDRHFEAGEEPVKLCLLNGQLVEFRKRPAADLGYDQCGESVGFFRFSGAMAARLAMRAEHYIQRGVLDAPYEEAIRDLVLERPGDFGCEDVTGLPWIEIDFPADLERARDKVLPRLSGRLH